MSHHSSKGPGRGGPARGRSAWGAGWGGPPRGAGNGNPRVQDLPADQRRRVAAGRPAAGSPSASTEAKIAALAKLAEVMRDETANPIARIIACERVLNRAVGRPRRQRVNADQPAARFVVFELGEAEPGLGHNGGPPLAG